MQKINKITQLFLELLAICYLRDFWACHTIPNRMTTLEFPWICNYMQQMSRITQPFPKILAVWYLGMPGIPDRTQQILHDLTKASMDI